MWCPPPTTNPDNLTGFSSAQWGSVLGNFEGTFPVQNSFADRPAFLTTAWSTLIAHCGAVFFPISILLSSTLIWRGGESFSRSPATTRLLSVALPFSNATLQWSRGSGMSPAWGQGNRQTKCRSHAGGQKILSCLFCQGWQTYHTWMCFVIIHWKFSRSLL